MKKNNLRKNYLINPSFQLSFMAYISVSILILLLLYYLAQLLLMKQVVDSAVNLELAENPSFLILFEELKTNMFKLYIIMSLVIGGFMAFLGMFLSHKIAGPLYRLRKYFQEHSLKSESLPPLSFRKKDFFLEVPLAFNQFAAEKIGTKIDLEKDQSPPPLPMDEKGFTFFEVMISAGIIGGLSLVSLKLYQNMNMQSDSVDTRTEITSLVNHVSMLMKKKENCQLSMQKVGAGSQYFKMDEPIPAIKAQKCTSGILGSCSTENIYEVCQTPDNEDSCKKYGNKFLLFTKITPKKMNNGSTYLEIDFKNIKKKAAGGNQIRRKIPLQMTFDSLGKITGCLSENSYIVKNSMRTICESLGSQMKVVGDQEICVPSLSEKIRGLAQAQTDEKVATIVQNTTTCQSNLKGTFIFPNQCKIVKTTPPYENLKGCGSAIYNDSKKDCKCGNLGGGWDYRGWQKCQFINTLGWKIWGRQCICFGGATRTDATCTFSDKEELVSSKSRIINDCSSMLGTTPILRGR